MKDKERNCESTNIEPIPINRQPLDDTTMDAINPVIVKLSSNTPVAIINGVQKKNNDGKSLKMKEKFTQVDPKYWASFGLQLLDKKRNHEVVLKCNACDFYCYSGKDGMNHIAERRHLKQLKAQEKRDTLSVLPKPKPVHLKVVTDLIMKEVAEHAMSEAKRKECLLLRKSMELEIKKQFPDISLLVNGSCLSGHALETSGLDLDLVLGNEAANNIGKLWNGVYQIFLNNQLFTDQRKNFASAYPILCFTHRSSGLNVTIGMHNKVSYYTNELISCYNSLDPRVQTLGIAFRYWANLCGVDKYSEGSLSPRSLSIMVIYFLQRCNTPVLPCLHTAKEHPAYKKPHKLKPKWKSSNRSSVGTLWIEMLRFYVIGINYKKCLIDITSPHYLEVKTKRFGAIAIEEPFGKLHGSGKNKWMSNYDGLGSGIYNFIITILHNTCYYFLVPQLSFGPLFHDINNASAIHLKLMDSCNQDKENSSAIINSDETDQKSNGYNIKTACTSESFYDVMSWPSYPEEDKLDQMEKRDVVQIENYTSSWKTVQFDFALQMTRAIQKHHLHLRFDVDCFTMSEKVPLICHLCHEAGHSKNNCHSYRLPCLCRLPTSYDLNYKELLGNAICHLIELYKPDVYYRQTVVQTLQKAVQKLYPTAVLDLFGSSASGFGLINSDLDICLTFDDFPDATDVNKKVVLKKLCKKLRVPTAMEGLRIGMLHPVLAAKVPIIKGVLFPCRWDIDISCYNILALSNTKLLKCYTEIDTRFKIIGYAIKFMAKNCEIGDASRGSLSSYAWIILVIHYLQNCSPPVLPVLQELYNGKSKPENIIDGWNTWFYNDIANLPKVWKEHNKNKMCVGELWIGFLRYYTEIFDWDSNVVSIRQLAPLNRLEKMWNTMCIAIEDPFDLNHNLGAGLSRSMSTYIRTALIHARQVFGNPTIKFRNKFEVVDHCFNKSVLMNGIPPNDKGCRLCGTIGHGVRNCPKKAELRATTTTNGLQNQSHVKPMSSKQKVDPLSDHTLPETHSNNVQINDRKKVQMNKSQKEQKTSGCETVGQSVKEYSRSSEIIDSTKMVDRFEGDEHFDKTFNGCPQKPQFSRNDKKFNLKLNQKPKKQMPPYQELLALSQQVDTTSFEQNGLGDKFKNNPCKSKCEDNSNLEIIRNTIDPVNLSNPTMLQKSSAKGSIHPRQPKSNRQGSSALLDIPLGDDAIPHLNAFIHHGQLLIDLGYRIYNDQNLPNTLLPGSVRFSLPVNNPTNRLHFISVAYTTSDRQEKESYVMQMRRNPFFLTFVQSHINNLIDYTKSKNSILVEKEINNNPPLGKVAVKKVADKPSSKKLKSKKKTTNLSKVERNWLSGTNVPKNQLYSQNKIGKNKMKLTRCVAKAKKTCYKPHRGAKSKIPKIRKVTKTTKNSSVYNISQKKDENIEQKLNDHARDVYKGTLRAYRSQLSKIEGENYMIDQKDEGLLDIANIDYEVYTLDERLNIIFD